MSTRNNTSVAIVNTNTTLTNTITTLKNDIISTISDCNNSTNNISTFVNADITTVAATTTTTTVAAPPTCTVNTVVVPMITIKNQKNDSFSNFTTNSNIMDSHCSNDSMVNRNNLSICNNKQQSTTTTMVPTSRKSNLKDQNTTTTVDDNDDDAVTTITVADDDEVVKKTTVESRKRYSLNNTTSKNGIVKRKFTKQEQRIDGLLHISKNRNEVIMKSLKYPHVAFYGSTDSFEVAIRSIYADGVQPYRGFDYYSKTANRSICGRLAIFRYCDLQNSQSLNTRYFRVRPKEKWYRKPITLADRAHLHQYLTADEFNVNLLSDERYDSVVDAIISYMLEWSNGDLYDFGYIYPEFRNLTEAVIEAREYENGDYVYDFHSFPVVQTSIKIIKQHFKPKLEGQATFDWMSLIDFRFIEHLRDIHNHLRTNEPFDEAMIKCFESDMPIPYKLPHIDVDTLKQYDRPDCLKFITGQACCCKTTIINKLTEMGWIKYSRGDLGGFNRKPENRAAVGNLHAALHHILTRSDVIGDRSFLDNVIWSFIMPECNPKRFYNILQSLLSFLNSNFNEPSIAEYISHKGVVFIDPRWDMNKKRQLNRCEDGDPWRARLYYYQHVQFLTYYAVARLFGWPVICVPYTKDGEIDDKKYQQNLERIVKFFGKPIPTNQPFVRFLKPSNAYTFDYTYPKSVGIYK